MLVNIGFDHPISKHYNNKQMNAMIEKSFVSEIFLPVTSFFFQLTERILQTFHI